MDVRLSPEQQALAEAATAMAMRLAPKSVRDLDDEERVAKLDAALDASGWRELRAAGDGAEPLASGVEVALVAERLAAALADAAYVGPSLAADLRRRAGAPAATSIETVLLHHDLGRIADPSSPAATVALDARRAGVALAIASDGGQHRLAAVTLAAPTPGTDLTRPVAVPADGATVDVLDAAALSDEDLTAWTAFGLAMFCADLVGAMRGALRLACEYVTVRRQYGVPVGSFQAVQHLLADAHVATEASASAALHAAWAVDALPPDEALASAAVAKAYCARAGRSVCETVIQVHGGIGNTWDCLAHLYLRRALVSSEALGGVGPSLKRVLAASGIPSPSPSGGAPHGLR